MSKYIELYKKYRPKKWNNLIGQQVQVRSIQRAIKANKLPTAYMFSGPRGCGKTSAALLTAKAVNCLNPDLNTSDPCNECSVCTSIDDGTQLGVTYISAAQIKGVDEMREIVNQARMQTELKQQVFIIDEIHNMKGSKGFEALLIPLEEEDMPSLFIFCTTEVEKVPDTILSRVQSRRFNLVSPKEMEPFITKLAKAEGIELDTASIKTVVKLGRGSVRDTITKLEEISTTGDTNDHSYGSDLLIAMSEHDVPKAWIAIAEAEAGGIDPRALGEQLYGDLRDLTLLSYDKDTQLATAPPVDDLGKVVKGFFGIPGLLNSASFIGEGLSDTTWGADARGSLELSVANSIRALKKVAKRKR